MEVVPKMVETENEEKKQIEKLKRINMVFKKIRGDYTNLFREYKKTANFKSPLLLLIRTTGELECYEDAKPGFYEFEHSSGDLRKLYIHPQHLKNCSYGKDTFKCWVAHEEYPDTSLGDPVLTTELFTLAIDKVQQELLEAKTKLEKAKGAGKMFWVWGILAIGAVIVGILLFYQPQSAPKVTETIKVIAINATTGGVIP